MVFTQKAMLYLGLILDESLLDKQLVWLWRKCRFDCAHCGFFQSHALGLLCFHPVHLPEVPWCVREGNLIFPETAHLPETQEISACSVSLFFLSFSRRGKGRGCFWRFDWGFYALQRGSKGSLLFRWSFGRGGSLYPLTVWCVWSVFIG